MPPALATGRMMLPAAMVRLPALISSPPPLIVKPVSPPDGGAIVMAPPFVTRTFSVTPPSTLTKIPLSPAIGLLQIRAFSLSASSRKIIHACCGVPIS